MTLGLKGLKRFQVWGLMFGMENYHILPLVRKSSHMACISQRKMEYHFFTVKNIGKKWNVNKIKILEGDQQNWGHSFF